MDSPRRVIHSFEFMDSGRRINAGSLDKILAKLPEGWTEPQHWGMSWPPGLLEDLSNQYLQTVPSRCHLVKWFWWSVVESSLIQQWDKLYSRWNRRAFWDPKRDMVKREDFHWCVYIYSIGQRVFYRDPLTLDSQIPGVPREWRTVSFCACPVRLLN